MSDVLREVLDDLAAEGDALDAVVAELDDDDWRLPTPATGWDVATQVAHLTWTDEVAVLAATDKARWDAVVLDALQELEGYVDAQAHELAAIAPGELMARWRASRAELREVLAAHPPGQKLPWFGPPMSPTSMATARLMETWAHGLDVREGLGVRPEPTGRLRHVAHLAVRTRDFAFVANGLTPPAEQFRVELTAPDAEVWEYGPVDAEQTVRGSAYDLCLLATQRVNRADTDLVAVGADAERWLDIAQCFAGPPGAGRTAR